MNKNNNLDIIIPVYNSDKQLLSTLLSIGYSEDYNIQNIIIIDDYSTENNNYKEIIDKFSILYNIIYKRLPNNCGPGLARQEGIKISTAKYLTFIDCGDLIYNTTFKRAFLLLEENPNTYVFSFGHNSEINDNHEFEYISPNHNRLLGKIFNREFLIKYNIYFNQIETKINEDIGFNIACRLICQDIFNKTNEIKYIEIDTPLIMWVYHKNSITRYNNHEFYFKQGKGLGINAIHAIQLAENNNVDINLIQEQAYIIFCHLYFYYISTLNIHPEFIEENLQGALYFYKNYFIKTEKYPLNAELFLKIYNKELQELYCDLNDPFFIKFPSFSIIDFLNYLEKKYKEEKSYVENNYLV